MHVSLRDAEAQLSTLIRRASAGEEVLIDDGSVTVRLVPLPVDRESNRKPTFGGWGSPIVMADDFDAPLEDFAEYMSP